MSLELKARLQNDMKEAMRNKDKDRLAVIRMMLAAIKQREIDGQVELDDTGVLAILDKQVKQRKDSVKQYREAGRDELAEKEAAEIAVIETYLPAALSEAEVAALIDETISSTAAASMKDMGKVMGMIKPKVQGKADMARVSAMIKAKLSGG